MSKCTKRKRGPKKGVKRGSYQLWTSEEMENALAYANMLAKDEHDGDISQVCIKKNVGKRRFNTIFRTVLYNLNHITFNIHLILHFLGKSCYGM